MFGFIKFLILKSFWYFLKVLEHFLTPEKFREELRFPSITFSSFCKLLGFPKKPKWTPDEARMDFNSLPDALLTNILKYTKFGKQRQLRRISRRIDQITRRSQLCTNKSFQKIQISPSCAVFVAERKWEDGTLLKNHKYGSRLLEIHNQYLAKVQILEELTLRKITIDENCLPVFMNNKRNTCDLQSLQMLRVDFSLSKEDAMILMRLVFPAVRKLTVWGGENTLSNLCCSEVLRNRKWKQLTIVANDINIDRAFLIEIAPKCEKFTVCIKHRIFPMSEIIEMQEKCILDGKLTQVISIGPVLLEYRNIEEMDRKFPFIQMSIRTVVIADYSQLYFKQKE